eukprot:scaffold159369_cov32-Tisochrysis_lutea.AAC.2
MFMVAPLELPIPAAYESWFAPMKTNVQPRSLCSSTNRKTWSLLCLRDAFSCPSLKTMTTTASSGLVARSAYARSSAIPS